MQLEPNLEYHLEMKHFEFVFSKILIHLSHKTFLKWTFRDFDRPIYDIKSVHFGLGWLTAYLEDKSSRSFDLTLSFEKTKTPLRRIPSVDGDLRIFIRLEQA